MKLYDYPQCPFGQKVRIVLSEKDLAYDMVPVDLIKGEQRTEEFLRLNPFGKVPVIVDEDTVVYESTIINEYLEDEYPHPQLMPADSSERARVRVLEDYADLYFTVQVGHLMGEVRKPEGERNDPRIAEMRQSIERVLAHLDAQLSARDYLCGEFSLADVSFAPRMMVLDAVGVTIQPEWAALRGWLDRLSQRPSIRDLEGFEGWR